MASSKNLIPVCFLVVFLITSVSAIAIGPGRTTLNFEPNLVKEIDFITRNHESVLEIYITGDLVDYLSCNPREIIIDSGAWYNFKCILSLPEKMAPGTHHGRVGVKEKAPKEEGTIAVLTAAESQINVLVQHDGFYLAMGLSADNVKTNEQTQIKANVRNWGDENITLSLPIKIYSSDDELVGEVTTNEKTIAPLEEVTLTTQWTANVLPGIYTLKTEKVQDGETFSASGTFRVGDLQLNLHGLNSSIKSGTIGFFDMDIESIWPEKIDFDIELAVKNDKTEFGKKTAKFVINSWERTDFRVYWDEPLEVGEYSVDVNLIYAGKQEEGTFDFVVSKEKIELPLNVIIVRVALGIVLSLLFILVLVYIIKKLFSSKKSKKLNKKKRR